MNKDLEKEREELLRLMKDETDESLRRMLALVPELPRVQETVDVATSTRGTGYAREK